MTGFDCVYVDFLVLNNESIPSNLTFFINMLVSAYLMWPFEIN